MQRLAIAAEPAEISLRARIGWLPGLACLATWLGLGLARDATADDLRWNQIQVIGSHNSYHIAPSPPVRALIATAGERQAQGLDYSHPPLDRQFSDRGIRQIELDLFRDPDGGRYAMPRARKLLQASGRDAGPDPNAKGELSRPGLKILHVPDVDYLSTAPELVTALKQVRDWSAAHPRHVPIFILLELKGSPDSKLTTQPLPFDRKALEAMEAEILSVFDRRQILTPADVRGDLPTLAEALRNRGWPALDDVRGKVAFALDNEDEVRDTYLSIHPRLDGQLLFASVPEDHPQAGWFKINDSIKDYDRIRRLVAAGFLVRTRADADTREARTNDPSRREKALTSGAQFVSTDYPVPDERLSTYCVQFPGHAVARPNPVSAPGRTEEDVEAGR
ncbi:hypothetical protein OJF2_23620 [Aquisphaera giovannonii]|uniref:Phosphoinositide phospholipase C, Ca2+-dependent n=1 Tax=Aquisphaera giovannonii TaxID=406548 RepID=A0A5B9VZP5_9BACT|nr:phosphatidylinositol-specific phospholipase C1-like protein [Aquisphaera giovannonii]QEH33832.1 hypothetical protein OJF2_23620 [Aquisphaera giovannonii]